MNIFFIPGLLCTNLVWGSVNILRNKYLCKDADVNFDSIEKMSDALLDSMPVGDVTIIGVSMGGYVAIDAALKLGRKLKKLILINTTPFAVDSATIADREKAMQLAELGDINSIVEMSKGICYYKPKEEWLLLEKKMANEVGPDTYINQQKAIINRKNYSNLIRNIVPDTLIIAGKNDKVVSYGDSVFMTENINNSSLLLLNECGHLSTLEKGSIVVDCVKNFLEK